MDGCPARGPAEAASAAGQRDVYFSADVETDGPIPGPYSMLSFALVRAGTFDGDAFRPAADFGTHFGAELRPISDDFEPEALAATGIDRDHHVRSGEDPAEAMTRD